ncbi:threonine--tRNA ligase [Candidatus Aerophobetes bacterium]|nr:threonine--tRNA ligase [Candidatus Aerophobetes bacterium]
MEEGKEINKEQQLEVLRHSTSHVLAQAVKRLFPEAKLGIGPPIKDGFYYDFDIDGEVLSKNLSKIKEEMKKIIKEDLPFEKEVVSKEEAKRIFKEREEPYKLKLLEEIEDEKVSIYRQGEFVDLCRGPHLESTGKIKHFALLSVAGAYWHGKEGNPMLSRIYGTCFFTKQELENYLEWIEEAKRRDHRKLGRELGIFDIYPELGQGLAVYHPNGSLIREIIENFEKEEHLKRDYQLVRTPHISKAELWKISGHLDFYRENMYVFSIDGEEYVLKPMNCPGHIMVYKSKQRSYKELPIKLFELGTVYRREASGVLHGLLRLRGFTQDDAHIFCMPSQLIDEVREVLRFCLFMMDTFNLGYKVTLSTRPAKSIGSDDLWERSTSALKQALEKEGIEFEIAPGEGAFYGPKIDIQMRDALGRLWQGPTVQVDFNLPERFNLTYVASGGEKKRVVMIHRVVLGTIDRFLGVLIEHVEGKFPVWLAPVQARILTITDKETSYAREIYNNLKTQGIRVELDSRKEMLNYKIREAQLQKIPYMVILGKRERESRTLTVRKRDGENIKGIPVEEFVSMVKEKVTKRN